MGSVDIGTLGIRERAAIAAAGRSAYTVTCGHCAEDGSCSVCHGSREAPALCDECDEPAAEEYGDGRAYLCESHAHPCWRCDGVGCTVCEETGSERRRREILDAAVTVVGPAPSPVDEWPDEPTVRLPPLSMADVMGKAS